MSTSLMLIRAHLLSVVLRRLQASGHRRLFRLPVRARFRVAPACESGARHLRSHRCANWSRAQHDERNGRSQEKEDDEDSSPKVLGHAGNLQLSGAAYRAGAWVSDELQGWGARPRDATPCRVSRLATRSPQRKAPGKQANAQEAYGGERRRNGQWTGAFDSPPKFTDGEPGQIAE